MKMDRIGRILWWGGLAVLLLSISGFGYGTVGVWEAEVGEVTRVPDWMFGLSLLVFMLGALVMFVGAIFKVIAWAKSGSTGDQPNEYG